ncbi:MAG: phosphoribosylglycinamide formyltransferase [Rhodospirillales bacterium]|nr:phosphoribosylglycinamide formyltransferase [Rhodospirillales bacterium]
MASLKLAVLISGRGSNLQSLIDACAEESFPAEIVTVISNVHGVKGLERAHKAGLPTVVIDHKEFKDRENFEDALHDVISGAGADLVCLAGFMRLLTGDFVRRWQDCLINIHPSLLPAFKGLHVHEKVLEAGARFSGCTVHYVRPDMDSGPIIVQAAVPVHGDDTPDTLATRILEQEHRIYPLAVRLIASGRVRVENERVIIDGAVAPDAGMINPAED